MTSADQDPRTTDRELATEIMRALRGLRFGSLEITVHDGRVVQLERREKVRPRGNDPVREEARR